MLLINNKRKNFIARIMSTNRNHKSFTEQLAININNIFNIEYKIKHKFY